MFRWIKMLSYFKNSIGGHDVIELKVTFIPKGLVPLERLFSDNDTLLKLTIQSSEENILSCNIGTAENPKLIKLFKAHLDEQIKIYIKLMEYFADIFSWSCEDLKTYDTNIIQHKIPLKPNTKPFKQKLRHMNPALLPIIEKDVKNILDTKIIVPLRYSS